MDIYSVITAIFVVLKLIDVIDWPWIWVLSPLWIPSSLYVVFIIAGFIYYITK